MVSIYAMTLTSRGNEIMIQTNKGLYFAQLKLNSDENDDKASEFEIRVD
jgi:hypothetical protein